MKSSITTLLLILFCTLTTGCSLKQTQTLTFDPTKPLRVAVLPFYQQEDGEFINKDTSIFLNESKDDDEDKAPEILRELVSQELSQTNFDIVPYWKVRADLVHNNYTLDSSFDYQKILSTSPKTLCELLGCDALLYGEVLSWGQSYYVAQSVSSVNLSLAMKRAQDGKVIYQTSVDNASSSGITGGPTGYTSLVLEPLKGLREGGLYQLANETVEAAIAPLVARNRPEFLDTVPPVILGSSHSAPTGTINPRTGLTVLAIGSAKKQAYFSIGDRILNIPMIEIEEGHYRGHYFPLPGESFHDEVVTITLNDRFGRSADKPIGLSRVHLQQ